MKRRTLLRAESLLHTEELRRYAASLLVSLQSEVPIHRYQLSVTPPTVNVILATSPWLRVWLRCVSNVNANTLCY